MNAVCPHCWILGPTRTIDIVKDDVVIGSGELCERCFGAALDEAAVLREQFEALIAEGVARAEANRIMIARINGEVYA